MTSPSSAVKDPKFMYLRAPILRVSHISFRQMCVEQKYKYNYFSFFLSLRLHYIIMLWLSIIYNCLTIHIVSTPRTHPALFTNISPFWPFPLHGEQSNMSHKVSIHKRIKGKQKIIPKTLTSGQELKKILKD